ncbi:DUF2254 domain-containing protein [Nonlabens ponticola]|uniref:DUF2254 domain-containing protein n=1 Tax=Nonlabens ponticola TaxID=2496866 RepID=A0A3S9MZ56_9FLAO|nr:DUF2254 domain-containing protein [Nonlabens ponticola]AZQ44541.1 DUF2254 domain-containing protein [Nonlabens ponticola]
MKKIFFRVRSFFNIITSSIAFYPTFYAVTAVILGIVMKFAEQSGISKYLSDHAPWLVVSDADTVRNILSTLIASGLSMLVFSFSMVMLLLSQAANNYSPRVLPSLIANRRHQTILGTFLAMILYNMITILGIESKSDGYTMPALSVFIGVLSAVIALAAFVYFIHSISTSIQINQILKKIYNVTNERLQEVVDDSEAKNDWPDTDDWNIYNSKQNGTLQNYSAVALQGMAEEYDIKFEFIIIKGQYIFEGQPIARTSKKLTDEQEEELYKNFNFNESELVYDNYVLGFKQIAEIGVKAMSPGINDPGTALDTINYLMELFALRMKKNDNTIIRAEDSEEPLIKVKTVDFTDLLYQTMVAYRTYCKHDMVVMQKLFLMMKHLAQQEAIHDSFYDVVKRETELLMTDARDAVNNQMDIMVLTNYYDEVLEILD